MKDSEARIDIHHLLKASYVHTCDIHRLEEKLNALLEHLEVEAIEIGFVPEHYKIVKIEEEQND